VLFNPYTQSIAKTQPQFKPIQKLIKTSWESYYARTLAHISHETPTQETKDEEANADADSDAGSDLNEEDDPGTSWFSEHNAPEKVLHFLTRKSFPLSPRNTLKSTSQKQPSVLDLGTGNGSMLALLRKRGGFRGNMVGVDYSRGSVELARELQRNRGHSAYRSDSEDELDSDDEDESASQHGESEAQSQIEIEAPPIQFEEWDILGSTAVLSEDGLPVQSKAAPENSLNWFPYSSGGFDIVLDKGTFDAVSLADDAKTTRVCERYPDIARRLVRRGGFLVVTTCNWTEEELVHWFTGGKKKENGEDRLAVWGRVEYPRFRFGGHEGQGVCTVCFVRVGSDV
jgi:SAM-dependent methyltransferase